MTTHDIDIELPPLPQPGEAMSKWAYDESDMQAYATAALEADRKRRGEPVAWYTEDHLADLSATTWDQLVAARWRTKGWPVYPLYAAPVAAQAQPHDLSKSLFEAAIRDLAAISEHLGIEPNEGGAVPIIEAIDDLRRERDEWADAGYAATQQPVSGADGLLDVDDLCCEIVAASQMPPGECIEATARRVESILRAALDAQAAEIERLQKALKSLIQGYVNTLEFGRDRIKDLGGDCDPVSVMEASDPHLKAARTALSGEKE